jgi:hypothetical protein
MSFTLKWICDDCGREISTGIKNVERNSNRKKGESSIPSFCIWCKMDKEKGDEH